MLDFEHNMYQAAQSGKLKPLFLCIEQLIDYENTTDYKQPILLEQAYDVIREAVSQDYHIVLLYDNQKSRKKTDLVIDKSFATLNYIYQLFNNQNIPICSIRDCAYRRPTNTPEGDIIISSTFDFVVKGWMMSFDECTYSSTFIGSAISRMNYQLEEIKNEYGCGYHSYYRTLTEFEKILLINNPNYLSVIQRERTCEKRKKSVGEKTIENWLITNHIKYQREYTFSDCKSKHVLRFDFVIFQDDKIKCIEFDGLQHIKPIDYFGGESAFLEAQDRDLIKNKYCEEHGIPLLRISDDNLQYHDNLLHTFINTII